MERFISPWGRIDRLVDAGAALDAITRASFKLGPSRGEYGPWLPRALWRAAHEPTFSAGRVPFDALGSLSGIPPASTPWKTTSASWPRNTLSSSTTSPSSPPKPSAPPSSAAARPPAPTGASRWSGGNSTRRRPSDSSSTACPSITPTHAPPPPHHAVDDPRARRAPPRPPLASPRSRPAPGSLAPRFAQRTPCIALIDPSMSPLRARFASK